MLDAATVSAIAFSELIEQSSNEKVAFAASILGACKGDIWQWLEPEVELVRDPITRRQMK